MIHQVTPNVWFGGRETPAESIGKVLSIINVANRVKFNWNTLAEHNRQVWFFRMAKRDREVFDKHYIDSLIVVLDIIAISNKFPVLTHCNLGRHRGPSAALLAAWHYGGRTQNAFYDAYENIAEVRPWFIQALNQPNPRRLYHQQIVEFCKKNSKPRILTNIDEH